VFALHGDTRRDEWGSLIVLSRFTIGWPYHIYAAEYHRVGGGGTWACTAAKVDHDHGPQIERALFASNF
jgi:hypothetical protein